MSLLGSAEPETKRKVPLTNYIGSYMAALFDANLASLKSNPHSSRLIDTVELTNMGVISQDKLVAIKDTDDHLVGVGLPNKPDLRVSDLSRFSELQVNHDDEIPKETD